MLVPRVKYPKPSAYRNHYLDGRRGMLLERRKPIKPEGPSVVRVRELAAREPTPTMREISAVMGVTYQRVQQIIRQYDIPWPDRGIVLEWECPGCGKWIRVARSTFENERNWNHMSSHCRRCSQEDRSKFCIRGHLRAENTSTLGKCLVCQRLRARCVIEVLTCEACGLPLNISKGMQNQARSGHATNKYHKACWSEKLGAMYGGGNKQTHCKWGHELTPESTYTQSKTGNRECRECGKRRSRERHERLKRQ